MRKYLLFFAILIVFFHHSETATAYFVSCDNMPNAPLSPCSECPQKICDYRSDYVKDECTVNQCPGGTTLIDCQWAGLYNVVCMDLECGDAGEVSAGGYGHDCIQDTALDSSCVTTSQLDYGWMDNTDFFSCTCDYTKVITLNRYTKKSDGTACVKSGNPGKCTAGKCVTIPPPPPTGCDSNIDSIIDTLPDTCCSSGKICKDIGGGVYNCVADASCPTCIDSDVSAAYPDGKNPKVKGTCKDTSNGPCTSPTGCTDTCASSGSVIDYYCAGSNPLAQTCMMQTIACPSSEFCDRGICDSASNPVNPSDPAPTPVGCTWLATNFNPPFGVCSSGCPTSYPDQQFVCCETAPLGCRSAPQCTSYNPQNGETPCCTTGGYYTCTAQETCTEIQNTSRKVLFIYRKS